MDLIVEGKYPDRNHYRPYITATLRKVINKAVHLSREKRYQKATAFRRDLEKTTIKCDWIWNHSLKTVIYKTNIDSLRIKVIIKQSSLNKFDIRTTIKRSPGGRERRILQDCGKNLSRSKMKSELHKIISRYVSEGK